MRTWHLVLGHLGTPIPPRVGTSRDTYTWAAWVVNSLCYTDMATLTCKGIYL